MRLPSTGPSPVPGQEWRLPIRREQDDRPGLLPRRLAGLTAGLAIGSLIAGSLFGCQAESSTPASPGLMQAVEAAESTVDDRARIDATVSLADLPLERTAWEFRGNAGHFIQTPNYDLYTTVRHDRVVERLPIFLEAALGHYRTALTPLPPPGDRMTAFVFGDRRQWEAKTVELIPSQAGELRNLGRGGFATRGIANLYYIDWAGRDRDTLAIAAHEGWHQYTQATFRNALPLWLEEGVATYMEGHRFGRTEDPPEFDAARNWERLKALRDARGEYISLRDLVSRSPQSFLSDGKSQLLAYYGQVWALTRFLVEHEDGAYRVALEEVLQDAADGTLVRTVAESPMVLGRGGRRMRAATSRTGPWILYAYFTDDLDRLETEYVAYMDGLVEEANERRRRWRRR